MMTPEELATLREGWVTYASAPVLKWDDAKMLTDLEVFAARVRAEAIAERNEREELHIVLTRGPGPESDFVEAELACGRGIAAGEWRDRPDGTVALVIPGTHEVRREARAEAFREAAIERDLLLIVVRHATILIDNEANLQAQSYAISNSLRNAIVDWKKLADGGGS